MRRVWIPLVMLTSVLLSVPTAGSVPSSPAASSNDLAAQIVSEPLSSASHSSNEIGAIYRLYVAYFDRVPEASGLWFWVDQHQSGLSLAAISDRFAQSSEFRTRYGSVDDEGFVALVYESVLHRTAEAEGLEHWQNEIANGLDRGAMMIHFSESIEFKTSTGFLNVGEIARLYSAALLRKPDSDGLAFWVARRSSGADLGAIATAFTNSPEFVERYGALSNDDFVRLIYLNVLGRGPDTQGLSYWSGELVSQTRGQVLIGFSNSAEYQTRTGIYDREAPIIPARPRVVPDDDPVPAAPVPLIPPPSNPTLPDFPWGWPGSAQICNFEVSDPRIIAEDLNGPDQAVFSYTFNKYDENCRRWVENGSLVLRVHDAAAWQVTGHYVTLYNTGTAVGSIYADIPKTAFDADLGVDIDASFVFEAAGNQIEFDWTGYVYKPLFYVIETDRDPDPIPFEQQVGTASVSILPNDSAPNRPLTVQARRLGPAPGCTPVGSRDDDSWTTITTGVAPLTVDIQVDLDTELGVCTLDVQVVGGLRIGRAFVHRFTPNDPDFVVAGSSACGATVCDASISFEYVPSRADYGVRIVHLEDVAGHWSLDLDSDQVEAGPVTVPLPVPRAFAEGFCVRIVSSGGTSSFQNTTTSYRCFVPDAGGWSETPLPDDRFDWD